MTKSALIALVLVGLFLCILLTWFFVPPSTKLFIFGTEHEITQSEAARPGVSSPQRGLNEAVESPATSPDSPTALKDSSFRPAASASKSAEPARLQRPASAFPDDEQPEELSIAGLVQDEEGYPLANVEVLAEPLHSQDTDTFSGDPSLESARSARTNFEGFFIFEDLAGEEYRIRVAPIVGFAPAETKARVGVMSASLVLVQLRNIFVYGIVSSTEGKPLEDVRVFGGTPPARSTFSGSKGNYELDIEIKGKNRPQMIHFRSQGYRHQSARLDPVDLDGPFNDFQLDVAMESLKELTTLTGRLEDPDGHPVVGKTIKMKSQRLQNHYHARSDASGHFTIEGVEPGKDYQMSVRSGTDYRNYEKSRLEIPSSGLQIKIVLEPLNRGELSGWMTDLDGKHIPGFAMTLRSEVTDNLPVQVVSDNTGFFSVRDFPEGSAVLRTNSFPIFEVRDIHVSEASEEPILVVLDMGSHSLFGQVTNILGDTVAAPSIFLGWRYIENGVQNSSARQMTADQNGSFAFTGLGPGLHTLRVNAPGFDTAILTINVGVDPNRIVVELEEES